VPFQAPLRAMFNTPRTGRCRRYPALKEVVLNQVLVSFGEDEFTSPARQLPGIVVMLERDVMPGVFVDAGCGFFQRVRLKR
jgi:hypothetical protein